MNLKFLDGDYFLRRYGLFADGEASADAGAGAGADAGKAGAGADAGAGAAAGADAGKSGADAGVDAGKGADKNAPWHSVITNPDAKKLAETSTDINHFAERTLDMRKKLSSAVFIPGKDAKPEEIAAFRKQIGVPDKPEEYAFDDDKDYKPTEADIAMRTRFSKVFHDRNVPAETAKALSAEFKAVMAEQQQAMVDADANFAKESEASLRKEWGPEYDKNKAIASRAAKDLFGEDFDAARQMTDKGDRFLLDNPLFMKVFAKLGREMGEGRIGAVITDSERGGLEKQIEQLRTDIKAAQDKGDNRKANELYTQEQALLGKLKGNQAIVGAQGRAA